MSIPTVPMQSASRASAWVAFALVSRTAFFAAWQAVLAGVLALAGAVDSWRASAAWWPVTALLANFVSIGLLVFLFRREGRRYWDLFQFERRTWPGDLLAVLGVLVLSAPLAVLPGLGLSAWLFGDPAAAFGLMLQPLPLWAAWVGVVGFPLTIALAELPTYFGYVMPRLGPGWRGPLLAALFLSGQHAALPLLFDWRFALWRAGMFCLFALGLAAALRWRPRLLPYLAIVHGLLDLQAAWMVLGLSV